MDQAVKIKEKREAADKEIAEIKRKNVEDFKERCRIDVAKKEERMEFLGRLHKEQREAVQEENILRAREAGQILPEKIEQTMKLAEGVLRLKSKLEKTISGISDREIREQIHRQVLRDGNIELKELESRLRSTYTAKQAQVQLREVEANRIEEKFNEKRTADLRASWYNDDTFSRRMEEGEIERRAKYRRDLQDQMIVNEILRQQRTEDHHRERKIVEEVGEVLRREDMQLAYEKREGIARIREEREAFFRAKEMWKSEEKEVLLDEFNRNSKIIRDKMIDEKYQKEKKSDESIARDLFMERYARRLLDREVERKEREDIADELVIEERNNEMDQALRNDAIRKEIIRRESLDDMERQKRLLVENQTRSKADDKAFGKYLADQYDIAVKNEEEKNRERRRKGIKYGKDLLEVREKQRALYAEEVLRRQVLHREDEKKELQRLGEVALERSKMLHEHAPKLEGFLRVAGPRESDVGKS